MEPRPPCPPPRWAGEGTAAGGPAIMDQEVGCRANSEYILSKGLSAIKGLRLTSRWNALAVFGWRRQQPERKKPRGLTGPPRRWCLSDVPPNLASLFWRGAFVGGANRWRARGEGNQARGKPARLSCVVTIFRESRKAIQYAPTVSCRSGDLCSLWAGWMYCQVSGLSKTSASTPGKAGKARSAIEKSTVKSLMASGRSR